MIEVTIKKKRVKLSDIKHNPDNPRQISDREMNRLIKSLQEFPEMMELREIVVDETMTVLGGNMRLQALQKIGKKECTAKIVHGLTLEQKREFMIKDNAAFGEWDLDALANAWGNLPLNEWGVKLPAEWIGDIMEADAPELRDGDRSPFQQMTFILHDEQAQEVKVAIDKAKAEGGGESAVNENSNGNALAFIATRYNRG